MVFGAVGDITESSLGPAESVRCQKSIGPRRYTALGPSDADLSAESSATPLCRSKDRGGPNKVVKVYTARLQPGAVFVRTNEAARSE